MAINSTGKRSKILKIILGYLIAAALLVALIRVFRFDAWDRLVHCRWEWIVAAVLATFAANLLGAWRWRLCLNILGQGQKADFTGLLYFQSTANLFSLTGLGTVLSMAVKPMILSAKTSVPAAAAVGSVALDRLLDFLLSLVMLIPAAFYLLGGLTLHQAAWWVLALMFLVSALGVVGGTKGLGMMAAFFRILQRLARKLIHKARRASAPESAGQTPQTDLEIVQCGRADLVRLFGLSLLKMAFLVLRLQWLAFAVQIELPFSLLLLGLAVLQLSLIISPTPGALGLAEWGWAAVLLKFGLSGGQSALASMAFRLYLTLFAVLQFALSYPIYRLCSKGRDNGT